MIPAATSADRPLHLKRLTVLRAAAALFVFANHLQLRGAA